MQMVMIRKYKRMTVTEVVFCAEDPILSGSVVINSTVRSVGQQTENVDFTDSGFDLEWKIGFDD